MKKLVVIMMLGLSVLFGNDMSIKYSDLNYMYDGSSKKCIPLNLDLKKYVFLKYQEQDMIVLDKLDSVAGITFTAVVEVGGKDLYYGFGSTFGACRLYEDYIIKDMNDLNPEDYKNLKYK